MNKSIIILLGLLVVLLPFGSNNLISNANAITSEDEYYNEQYNQRYANDEYDYGPEQDRSYGNNYYDRENPKYEADYNEEDKSYKNHDYKSKDKERNSVSISKINCNTVNYNVIGNVTGDNNIDNDGSAANSNEGLDVNTYGNNGERYDNGYDKNKDFSCIINNNNTIITGSGGNETVPPEPTKTTLTVIKQVRCVPSDIACSVLLQTMTPANFTIKVDGPGGSTETFQGSATGTLVQLDAGVYTITEAPPTVPQFFTLATTFSGSPAPGCIKDPDPTKPFTATGTIVAGVPQTCAILNTFDHVGPTVAPSSITAQGTADSPALTAMDKITKLKTQWLNQLP